MALGQSRIVRDRIFTGAQFGGASEISAVRGGEQGDLAAFGRGEQGGHAGDARIALTGIGGVGGGAVIAPALRRAILALTMP